MLPDIGLVRITRDDPQYWSRKPRDHNGAGLFASGPQEARPSWAYKVPRGNAEPATESGAAARRRQTYEREQAVVRMQRRAGRFATAITGRFVGRNR